MTARDTLSKDAARGLRGDLKAAQTGFANGRGSVEAVLHEIERIAKYVSGKPDIPLGRARKAMKRLVRQYAPAQLCDTGLPGVCWDDLYSGVVNGRNDLAHTGTEAALVGARVATLATVLLVALTALAKTNRVARVKDVMVSNPICAHGWQTLADLRRTMLVNDYSALPLSRGANGDGRWGCVRAEEVAALLAREEGGAPSRVLAEVLSVGCDSSMSVYLATVVQEETPLSTLLGEAVPLLPVVVTRPVAGLPELVGIVTAFDLL